MYTTTKYRLAPLTSYLRQLRKQASMSFIASQRSSREIDLGDSLLRPTAPAVHFLPSLTLSLPPHPPKSRHPPSFPFPSIRSRAPKIQLGDLGERCKLPQRGLGRNPSRNRIWCIFALKSNLWLQQFSRFLENQILTLMANFLTLFMQNLEML